MDIQALCRTALTMRGRSYAPYSGFRVGAALLTKDGRVFTGCNIEIGSFSSTCCAERTAFFKAVSEGASDFAAIAIAGGADEEPDDYCPPCGVCREVMSEFCNEDFLVILAKTEDDYQEYTLGELLPVRFALQ